MNIPEIIDAEVSGYCDIETGECITVAPITPDDKIVSEREQKSDRSAEVRS